MKICRILLAVSWVFILALGYLFWVKGNVGAPDKDGRTVIMMTKAERALIMQEMRGFLVAVEGITSALAENKLDEVAKIAKPQGKINRPPLSLLRKLPLGFKKMGHPTHALFDELAEEASTVGDVQSVTAKLSEILQRCTACHASYAIEAE